MLECVEKVPKQYTALQIANYIISYCNKVDKKINNLKLQKILYYVQARFLVESKATIFSDDIEKWKLGPVVPDVYHNFKNYGSSDIDKPTITIEFDEGFSGDSNIGGFKVVEFNENQIDCETKTVIEDTVNKLINFDSFDLVRKTHEHNIWKCDSERINNGVQNIKYDNLEIQREFEHNLNYRLWE